MAELTMDKLVSLCKRRGFVFQSSEIYGGLSSAWDYGPLGSALKRNIQDFWWREMTQMHQNISTPTINSIPSYQVMTFSMFGYSTTTHHYSLKHIHTNQV